MNSNSNTLIWVVLILLIVYLGYQFNPPNIPKSRTLSNVGTEVTVRSDALGHFILHGRINGQRVNFLYDTGATLVAIPEKVAKRLGLKKGMRYKSTTANGTAIGYLTRLNEIQVGNIVMKNIPASIAMGLEGDKILLGMSFLNRVESRRYKGKLTLRVRD